MTPRNRPFSVFPGATLLVVVTVVAALYFAREVLIPLALAVLFSFLLAPLVIWSRRRGLGRTSSALIVVLLAFAVAGWIGEFMASQMVDLARKMPEYQQNIRKKLQAIGAGDRGVAGRVINSVESLRKELMPAAPVSSQTQTGQASSPKPVPVEIQNSAFSPFAIIRSVLGSLVSILTNAFIVVVFIIFMLIELDDLRDRLIRLIGMGRLNLTTQALSDASQRVSRYLLMQLLVNVGYGIPIGLGLFFIGIPNPLLWAFLTSLLRYIPYAGAWIAASMPFAVAVAVDPDWTQPLLVLGLYAAVELVVANALEPWLYGTSTGITPLAVLVAAVFWTWLWGPLGLLLSTPLTVCLVSIGRYAPSLSFLTILLGDEPVLPPAERFYQRMLARNRRAARTLAEEFLREKPLEELYDQMIVPALVLAERDHQRGSLDGKKHKLLLRNTRLLVAFLVDYASKLRLRSNSKKNSDHARETGFGALNPDAWPVVVCVGTGREVDEIMILMLGQSLGQREIGSQIFSVPALIPRDLNVIKERRARLACISAVSPDGLSPQTRDACKQIAGALPEFQEVVGLWGAREAIKDFQNLFPAIPPANLASGFKQAIDRIAQLILPASASTNQPPEAAPAKR